MNEDFVTYELAVKLKEKGFREECIATYDIEDKEFAFNNYVLRVAYQMNITTKDCLRVFNDSNCGLIDAPTIPQVLKWLRDVKKLHLEISFWSTTGTWSCKVVKITNLPDGEWNVHRCKSYEDAAIKAIEHLLKYWI